MEDDSTRQSVLFSDFLGKPVIAKFDQEHASSDGGAILLQACDRQLGLTAALVEAVDDRRQLRLRAARTAFRSAQVSTLREHLMKLGTWVESSVRRIVLHLPASCIHRRDWQIIARSLGAAPA